MKQSNETIKEKEGKHNDPPHNIYIHTLYQYELSNS